MLLVILLLGLCGTSHALRSTRVDLMNNSPVRLRIQRKWLDDNRDALPSSQIVLSPGAATSFVGKSDGLPEVVGEGETAAVALRDVTFIVEIDESLASTNASVLGDSQWVAAAYVQVHNPLIGAPLSSLNTCFYAVDAGTPWTKVCLECSKLPPVNVNNDCGKCQAVQLDENEGREMHVSAGNANRFSAFVRRYSDEEDYKHWSIAIFSA